MASTMMTMTPTPSATAPTTRTMEPHPDAPSRGAAGSPAAHPLGPFASPALLIKNLGGDRGASLLRMLPLDPAEVGATPGRVLGGGGARVQLHPAWARDPGASVEPLEQWTYRAFWAGAAALRSHAAALGGAAAACGGPLALSPSIERATAAAAVSAADALAAADALERACALPFQRFPVALLYAEQQRLQDHVDGFGGYVALHSVGSTVRFACCGLEFDFESGDVFIFNGAAQHQCWHGVRGVRPGSAPEALPAWIQPVRVSITMRQA